MYSFLHFFAMPVTGIVQQRSTTLQLHDKFIIDSLHQILYIF